jgi:hypothetical protein
VGCSSSFMDGRERQVERAARLEADEAVTFMDLIDAIVEAGVDDSELLAILSHLFSSGRIRFQNAASRDLE